MAKTVGLTRNLKLQWLNKVSELALMGLTQDEIKEQLNEYLSFEINSPTNLRKTREILMNIWFYENKRTNKIKTYATEILRKYPEYSLELHWCMMMAAYPVFTDMCKIIGKISGFQDGIVMAQLKQKLFDEWGERTTLHHSIDKMVATLKDMNVMICDKPGRYHINKRIVTNTSIVTLMIYTKMMMDDRGYYTFEDLQSSDYFFPFEYKIEKQVLLEDSRFAMNRFGSELSISIKE